MNARSSLPFRVGLTGGIASGKTEVTKRFAELGVPIIDTDQLARAVVLPGTPALQQITAHFGAEILNTDGTLDRRSLRKRVFDSDAERRFLESILHPAIRVEQERLAALVGGPYQVHVAPLLVETSSMDFYDRVLVVDCPRELQRQRLMARDQISAELADRMLDAQATREQRLSAADDVLENSGMPGGLAQKVERLHEKYLKLAASREQ